MNYRLYLSNQREIEYEYRNNQDKYTHEPYKGFISQHGKHAY